MNSTFTSARKSRTIQVKSPELEVVQLAHKMACLLLKNTKYTNEQVLNLFDKFAEISANKVKKGSSSVAEKRKSFLQNLRLED